MQNDHEADFDWHEHAVTARPLIMQQEEIGRKAQAASTAAATASAATTATPSVTATPPTSNFIASPSPIPESSASAPPTTESECACSNGQHSKQHHHQDQHTKQPEGSQSQEVDPIPSHSPASLVAPSPSPGSAVTSEPSHSTGPTVPGTLSLSTGPTGPGVPSPSPGHTPPGVPSPFPAPTPPGAPSPSPSPYEPDRWEEFFVQQSSVKFFKLRRYLLLEFPMLLQADPPLHVVELGAGCGSSILPVLTANETATTAVTDVSATCLVQLRTAAQSMGISQDRIADFVADSCDLGDDRFEGLSAGAVLIMFTLSAVLPDQQIGMLRNAWRSLKPGGLCLIRDHGLYDMVQMRIPPEQWVAPNSYKRGDGTISHFFSIESMEERARAAGLEPVEVKYVTIINHNKKRDIHLKRVFIHAVLRRPQEP
eukprot:gene20352-27114_t